MLNRLPAEERRAQLVEAALSIAERGGIAAVTIRAVAEEAGVSLGVVHYCFESKEALVAAMAESLVLQLSAGMRESFASVWDSQELNGLRDLREVLHTGLTGMWPLVEATADRQLLTYEITAYALRHRAAGAPLAGSVADEQYRTMDIEATVFLQESARRTGTTWTEPVEAIARFALAVIDGIVLRWLVDRDSNAIITELDDLVRIVASKAVDADPDLDNRSGE
ncbi:TetR family transcriptional regulator [Rhodococcus sp. TAF43]|uniref:TetR/AcrR family transcriptional regulator n=1 Tax=unclassified Rhodococcus (in: high G+C Gram-positive bacteria) TaxID=192944 RepID=UPI001583EDDB|nr:TetR family transcriptional regulator [Rhodococcus sp. W8901]QKT10833.1 TetR family transcriptional regulator [Rhodococcus sp. W8901]